MTLKILGAYLIFFLFNLALNAILTHRLGKGWGKARKSQEGPFPAMPQAFLINIRSGKRIEVDPAWADELAAFLADQDQIRIERGIRRWNGA